MSELVPLKHTCDELNLRYSTVKAALYRGEIPYQRTGRELLVTMEDVMAWWRSPRTQARRGWGRRAFREHHGDDEPRPAKQICEQLGIPYSNINRVLREGRIPCIRDGRVYLVRASDVVAWLKRPRQNGGRAWSSDRIPAGRVLQLECGRQVVIGVDERGLPYPVPPEYYHHNP